MSDERDLCQNCGKRIPRLEERHAPSDSGEGGNVPYVWWRPEQKYACSEECYRVAYLGCAPSKSVEKKKSVCHDCRALRGRCPAHSVA